MRRLTAQLHNGILTGIICLPGVACLLHVATVRAQEPSDQVVHAQRYTTLTVPIYKSRVVTLSTAAKRVSIGNPDIADVLILGSSELYVLGKDLGATNVLLWDSDQKLISSLSVFVTHDLEGLRQTLATVMPGEKIQVASAQRDIVLSGQVTSALKMDAALQVAHSYLQQAATAKEKIMFKEETGMAGGSNDTDRKAGQVLNLMTVGGAQEIMLQVKVAEVQRSVMNSMNAQFNAIHNNSSVTVGGVNGGATFPPAVFLPQNASSPVFGSPNPRLSPPNGGNPIGPYVSLFQPTTPTIGNQGLFGAYVGKELAAQLIVDAAAQQGLARILAEPTVTTLNGQEAQFLSGGSFPIPVPEQNGVIGIDYKDFGVKLIFQPLILESGRINLKLNISVSQLVTTNSLVVTPITSSAVFAVPALSERRALSTVELSDGQTIAIAGLMNENMNSAVTKFPGLGDIPILGQLFRSQNFQKGQTELVIFVTPTLAKPVKPTDVRLPTDGQIDPSNLDFFLLGRMEGRAPPAAAQPPATAPPASAPPTSVPPAQ
jgi:pilus assembly protein CpaC